MSSDPKSADIAEAIKAQNQEEALLEEWLSKGDRRAVQVVKSHKRQVSQSAFDDAVRENIEEFDMAISEAIADARATFAMQKMEIPAEILTDDSRYELDTKSPNDEGAPGSSGGVDMAGDASTD